MKPTLKAALCHLRLLPLLLTLLQPASGFAQLVISGTDEYAQLIFEVRELDESEAVDARLKDGTTATSRTLPPGPADPAPRSEAQQSITSLEAGIDAALAENGLYSPQLRAYYQRLGELQQRLGQHESAVATLEKSVHIARVAGGLYTPEQEADIERIIESLRAMGDLQGEADYRSYLYYMQQRAYDAGDPRIVAARLAWADWNLDSYLRSAIMTPRAVMLPGSDIPEELVVIRNAPNGEARFVPRRYVMNMSSLPNAMSETSRYSMTPEMAVDTRLRAAREIYEELLQDAEGTLEPEQREALRLKLVGGEYAFKRHMDRLLGEVDDRSPLMAGVGSTMDPIILRRGFRDSSALLEQEVQALEAATPGDPLALATAYLRQADLYIAYRERRNAEPSYAKAWSTLMSAGFSEADATAWLQPAPLLPVPDYAIHPYSRELFNIGVDDTLPYRGYIDVSLNLTRDGSVRRAEITAASEDTPQRVRRLLLSYLRNQKMRPPLAKGIPVEQEGLTLRFEYSY